MAKIIDTKTFRSEAATTFQVVMPDNIEDDLIVCLIGQDGAASTDITVDESFTILDQNYWNGGTGKNGQIVIAYKIAGSGGQTTAPTFTSAVSEEWASVVSVIRGADTADPINGYSAFATADTANTTTGQTITTDEDDVLVLHAIMSQSGSRDVLPEPVNAANFHHAGATCVNNFGHVGLSLDWSWQETAGATTAAVWFGTSVFTVQKICVGINDSGDGYIPVFVDPGTQPIQLIEPLRNTYYPVGGGSEGNMASYIPTIHSKTTMNNPDNPGGVDAYLAGLHPWCTGKYFGTNASGAYMGAFNYRPATLQDLTWGEGLFMCALKSDVPPGAMRQAPYANGGLSLIFYDDQADEEFITFMVGSNDSQRTAANWLPVVIQVDDTQGTARQTYLTPDLTAIEGIGVGNETTALTNYLFVSNFSLLDRLVLAGGSSTQPMSIDDLWAMYAHSILNVGERLGSTSILAYIPTVIGGPSATFVDIAGLSLQFPESFNENTILLNVHVADNKLGLTLDGNTGDTISIRNSLIGGATPWHFRFASGAAGTYDLFGTTITGAGEVTLRDLGQALSGVTFAECASITLNGCALDGVTISDSTGTEAIELTSTAEAADLSNIAFVDNINGHSILISATGTYTFDNFTFTGGGSGGSSTADVFNDSGGSVTINVTGGGDTPTVKNGTSASTTVQNSVTVTVEVLDDAGDPIENARVLLETSPGGTDIIAGLTNASGIATASYAYTTDQAVTGWVRKSSGSPYYKQGTLAGTITSTGYTATVVMVADE